MNKEHQGFHGIILFDLPGLMGGTV